MSFFPKPLCLEKNYIISPIRKKQYVKPKKYLPEKKIHKNSCILKTTPSLVFIQKQIKKTNIDTDYENDIKLLLDMEQTTPKNLINTKNLGKKCFSSIKIKLSENDNNSGNEANISNVNTGANTKRTNNENSFQNLTTSPLKTEINSPARGKKQKIKLFQNSKFVKLPPIMTPKSSIISDYNYTSLSQQGFYFDTQKNKINQDRVVILHNILQIPNFSQFCILDGHGQNGHYISEICKSFLQNYYNNSFLYYFPRFCSDKPVSSLNAYVSSSDIYKKLVNNNYDLIRKCFQALDTKIKKSEYEKDFSGTTACQVFITDNKIICANIGDSRAIMIKKRNKIVPLSNDHKPSMISERNRIEFLGGEIKQTENKKGPLRIWVKGKEYPGLAMSRSLGDFVAKDIGVISEPEIIEFEKDKDTLGIIIASDGVWDNLSNERVRDIFIQFYSQGNESVISEEIEKESRKLFLEKKENVDDISVIVIYFKS